MAGRSTSIALPAVATEVPRRMSRIVMHVDLDAF
jgi:hypothetical protein